MRGWFSEAEDRNIQFIFPSPEKGKIPFEIVYHADTPSFYTAPFNKVIHQTPSRGKYIFGKAVPISEGEHTKYSLLAQTSTQV